MEAELSDDSDMEKDEPKPEETKKAPEVGEPRHIKAENYCSILDIIPYCIVQCWADLSGEFHYRNSFALPPLPKAQSEKSEADVTKRFLEKLGSMGLLGDELQANYGVKNTAPNPFFGMRECDIVLSTDASKTAPKTSSGGIRLINLTKY